MTFNKEETAFIKSIAQMTLEMVDVAVAMNENNPKELAEEKAKAQGILNKIKGFSDKA